MRRLGASDYRPPQATNVKYEIEDGRFVWRLPSPLRLWDRCCYGKSARRLLEKGFNLRRSFTELTELSHAHYHLQIESP